MDAGAPSPRPVRVASLGQQTAEGRQAARDNFYFDELERQAHLANWQLGQAFLASMHRNSLYDFMAWAHLQGAMFAAIVVQRLLDPKGVRQYPHHASHGESKRTAKERAARLRKTLEIPDDSPLLTVSKVRDSFEHFDERLDIATRPGVISVSDWYISDSTMMRSATFGDAIALGLRCYVPSAGLLYYDDEPLDLFVLDDALYDLRDKIGEARRQAQGRPDGAVLFRTGQLVQLSPEIITERFQAWLDSRVERGEPIPVTLKAGN